MIRFAWVVLVIALATLFFGSIAIVAALFRVRSRVYFWCTQGWSRTILWASGTTIVTHGLESVNWDQPLVLVSNHISGYDIFAIASVLPVPFYFIGKKELDRIPFFGLAWRAAGHISIDRSDRAQAVQSLSRAADKIRRDGGTVIIFPEGTRSRSAEMLPFKKGAFSLAREARAPVVPVIVLGSDRIQPGGRFRIHPHTVHLFFGDLVPPDPVGTESTENLAVRVRTRMEEMQRAARSATEPALP